MKPLDYLFLQMELEGIQRVGPDLIDRLPEAGEYPLVLAARTSDGDSLLCFDRTIAEDVRGALSIDDLLAFKFASLSSIFQTAGVRTRVGHFKTYIFPEYIKDISTPAVRCFDQADPRVSAFGFSGLADLVYAIEEKGALISACVSSRQNTRCAEAWVFTHLEQRRRGLAQQVVSAWAGDLLRTGLIPLYSHQVENTASARLARRLNLIPVFEETVLEQVS